MGLGTGVVVAVLLLALRHVLPPLFTDDPAVLAQAERRLVVPGAMQPLAGVVFALDGVLMGAGDVAYLRTVTSARRCVGFVPLSLLSAAARLGAGRGVDRADACSSCCGWSASAWRVPGLAGDSDA